MDLIVDNDAGGKEEECFQNQTTFHTLSLEWSFVVYFSNIQQVMHWK